jgi:hypothetical protein
MIGIRGERDESSVRVVRSSQEDSAEESARRPDRRVSTGSSVPSVAILSSSSRLKCSSPTERDAADGHWRCAQPRGSDIPSTGVKRQRSSRAVPVPLCSPGDVEGMVLRRGVQRFQGETVQMVGRGFVQDGGEGEGEGLVISVDHLLDLFE